MIIRVSNNLQVDAPKTYTSFAEVGGTNVLRWKNPAGINASWAIQVGETGEEQAEVVLLNSSTPAGTAGTLTANTLYPHPADTPIYAIKFNQVVFEKSATGTAGAATPITDGTVAYQADSQFTQFDDASAVSTDAFRARFRNSVLGSNTAQSDWITPAGPTFYSLAKMRERIKNQLWNATYVSDAIITDWVNEWKDELSNAVIAVNQDYALGTVNVGFGTDGLGTITTNDFYDVRRVWITTNGVDSFQSTKMNINDFLPTQIFTGAHPYHAWLGGTIIQVKPSDSAGTASLVFYRFGTAMVNDTDELPYPFRSYTKSFVDYCAAQTYYKDGNDTAIKQGDRRMAQAIADKALFVKQVSARDKSGKTYIDVVEPLSSADGFLP